MNPTPPAALSIAGSDPSGGAGIQADLKTFLAHDVYGMAAITCTTAQNTRGVSGVQFLPDAHIDGQVRDVLDDIPPGAIKIGMLGTASIIRTVQGALAAYDGPVVLDPVMVATSGDPLLQPDAEEALRHFARTGATLVTPNIPEAARLLQGQEAGDWAQEHGTAILLKGGHADGSVVCDTLHLPDGTHQSWWHTRIDSRNTHGTGCTLSSAIAARLARGEELTEAVGGALSWLAALIAASAEHGLGGGHGPLLHGLQDG